MSKSKSAKLSARLRPLCDYQKMSQPHHHDVHAQTHLGELDEVQEDGESGAIELEVNPKGEEGAVVWRGPTICREMQAAGIFLMTNSVSTRFGASS